MCIVKNHVDLLKSVINYKTLAIYGYGFEGMKIKHELEELDIDYFVFTCTDKEYKKTDFRHGIQVIEIDRLCEYEHVVVLLSRNSKYFDKMLLKCSELNLNTITFDVGYRFEYQRNIELFDIYEAILSLKRKLSMKDDIWQIKKIKFYVPNYPYDFIQKHIVDENEFFEQDILEKLNIYIPENAVILDIGSNIGNHLLYWAIERNAKKIIAFEPVADTFKILEKNVKLNGLENKTEIYNIGLSDNTEYADFKTYREDNIGDTHLMASDEGEMRLAPLDDLDLNVEKIDFIKIDVEDYEVKVIKGAISIIQKYKPLIFVETYPDYYEETNALLNSIGYEKIEEYEGYNYLYRHNQ